MKSILGLDLGTNSLGYAIITEEGSLHTIHSGVDIFPAGKANIGLGTEESNNATRRSYRQTRRQYARKRLRKQHLLALLIQYNMCPLTMEELDKWRKWDREKKSEGQKFPDSETFRAWLALKPYQLRAKGLYEELTREEFGRVLYSMIQRRGFLSSRKTQEDTKTLKEGKKSSGIKGIEETQKGMGNKTLGEYLYQISQKDHEPYSNTSQRIRSRYTRRDMYIREFEALWNAQAPHLGLDKEIVRHPHKDKTLSLKEHLGGKIWKDEEGELRYRSNESVLFWQRPLRSQKGLLDRCAYEGNRFYKKEEQRWVVSGPKVIPLSHPLFEVYRAMQQVSNITLNGRSLSSHDRTEVYKYLLSQKNGVKLSQLKRKFKYLVGQFNYEDDFLFASCPTIAKITNLLKGAKATDARGNNDKIVYPIPFDMELYVKIWHKLYNFDDNKQLTESLERMGEGLFKENLEELVSKVTLEEGYGNVSHHALENIVPFMQRGIGLYESVLLGGMMNVARYANNKRKQPIQKVEFPEAAITFVLNELPRTRRKQGETIEAIMEYVQSPGFGLPMVPDSHKLKHLLYHPSQPTLEYELQDKLPKVENLRNPLVEQALWALRRRVNSLLNWQRDVYGEDFRFDEIHIELARELKASKKGRQEIQKRQRENELENDEAREIIRGYGLSPTRINLQKYKLYKELAQENGGVALCPYTGKVISLSDALGRDSSFEIEHIVPRSVSNNDSFANKTLCDAGVNRLKGNRTPWEYYESTHGDEKIWGVKSWEEVSDRARRVLPFEKYKLFTSKKSGEELAEGFSNRQLTDTAYMSKKAREYLTSICDKSKVINISGSVTAELRKLWGLNNVLSEEISLSSELLESLSFPEGVDRMPVSVLLDKQTGEVEEIYPKFAPTPIRQEGDFFARVEKKADKLKFGRYDFRFPQELYKDIPDGKYYLWVQAPKVVDFQEQFNPFPIIEGEDAIIVKVNVDNTGTINRAESLDTSLFKKLEAPTEPGKYWVRIPVQEGWQIKAPTDNIKPQKDEILCNGYIADGKLRARPFYTDKMVDEYPTKNVQVIVKPMVEKASFVKIMRSAPEIEGHEMVITGAVVGSLFTSQEDITFMVKAEGYREVAHYCKLSFLPEAVIWLPFFNPTPTFDTKNQVLIEGEVDRYKGNTTFTPRKNRDDHRHHALDAIVIAEATRSNYQALSTYNGLRDNYARGSEERPRFALPWPTFREDAIESIKAVLVNHKKKGKVVNLVKKSIRKNGTIYQSAGLAVRGQLWKATYYGKRKNPISQETAMHTRKPIESIDKSSQLEKVVDPAIRALMIKRLEEMGVDTSQKGYTIPKGAFVDNGQYMIHLPNKNGEPIPVKKVRIGENISNAIQVGKSNQYVDPRNNEHIILYEAYDGSIKEEIVAFWEVAHRVSHGEDAVQLPKDCAEVLLLLRSQELYLIGLSRSQVTQAIVEDDNRMLSKYLYRLQKMSSKYYVFRLHNASTINNDEEMVRVTSLSKSSLSKIIHVELNDRGQLEIK